MGFTSHLIVSQLHWKICPTVGGGSFLDEGHDSNPHLVSRTAAPTTTSLPDFPWSQKHKFPNSLFTREFHMRQLSKGIGSDQN